jgi:hypothetical protein
MGTHFGDLKLAVLGLLKAHTHTLAGQQPCPPPPAHIREKSDKTDISRRWEGRRPVSNAHGCDEGV